MWDAGLSTRRVGLANDEHPRAESEYRERASLPRRQVFLRVSMRRAGADRSSAEPVFSQRPSRMPSSMMRPHHHDRESTKRRKPFQATPAVLVILTYKPN